MFDLGTWGELFIIALAALIFIGPKEMPSLLRTLGRLIQRLKFLSSNIRHEVNHYIQEGEIDAYIQKANKEGMMTSLDDDPIVDEEKNFKDPDDKDSIEKTPPKKKKAKKANAHQKGAKK